MIKSTIVTQDNFSKKPRNKLWDATLNEIQSMAWTYGVPVDSTLIHAMSTLDRIKFGGLYSNTPEPIGHGQTISQPFMVAIMTQLLINHTPDFSQVIEIGTGSGYQAALLSNYYAQVSSFERIQPLHLQAKSRLSNYTNIECILDHGNTLSPDHQASALIATCGVTGPCPSNWVKALKNHGVCLVPQKSYSDSTMQLRLYQKTHDRLIELQQKKPVYCRFVPFINKD